jgi:CRISPR-associated protein Cas1
MPKVALIVDYGATLKVKDGRFQLHVPEKREAGREYVVRWDLSPPEVEAIVVAVKGVSVSAAAIDLAARNGIHIYFFSGSKPLAHLLPATYSPVQETWLAQIRAASDPQRRLLYARLFAEGKLANQRTVLEEYEKRARASGNASVIPPLTRGIQAVGEHLSKLQASTSVDEVRQEEALAAKAYWEAIAALLPPNLGFELRLTRQRIRAEPDVEVDPFNRALNIGYSALLREVWAASLVAGLNLMEEFRAVAVDRPLITLARTHPETLEPLRSNNPGHEDEPDNESREAFIAVWREVTNYMANTNPPLTQQVAAQAGRLSLSLRGREEYRPYRARW